MKLHGWYAAMVAATLLYAALLLALAAWLGAFQ